MWSNGIGQPFASGQTDQNPLISSTQYWYQAREAQDGRCAVPEPALEANMYVWLVGRDNDVLYIYRRA